MTPNLVLAGPPEGGLDFGSRLVQFRIGQVYVQFLGYLLGDLLDVLLILYILALARQVTSKRGLDANSGIAQL